jgi:hypothetical protein
MQKTLQYFFHAFCHVFPVFSAFGWRFFNINAKMLTELFGRFCQFLTARERWLMTIFAIAFQARIATPHRVKEKKGS